MKYLGLLHQKCVGSEYWRMLEPVLENPILINQPADTR